MNVQVFGHIGVDMLEKAEVLLMAVTVSALSENFAGGDVEGRKQCRGAVPNVIMRHAGKGKLKYTTNGKQKYIGKSKQKCTIKGKQKYTIQSEQNSFFWETPVGF